MSLAYSNLVVFLEGNFYPYFSMFLFIRPPNLADSTANLVHSTIFHFSYATQECIFAPSIAAA